MERHAVYATCIDHRGERLTFRVGLPVAWDLAIARWYRLDNWRTGFGGARQRRLLVRWARRQYRVLHFEVRSVDRHGRGLGSDRHALAFPVPYRLCRSAA